MLGAMTPPRSLRPRPDAERAALEAGRRRQEAFTVRRGQIWRASAARQTPSRIAKTLRCAPHTGRHGRHAVDARGLACVPRGANVPVKVEPVRHAEHREPWRAILPHSPRTSGQPARVWPLTRRAEVGHEQGLRDTTLSCPPRREALVRLGVRWPRAHPWLVSPDPADGREAQRRARLLQLAAHPPAMALGFDAEGGCSREAQPQRPAWSEAKPVRLVGKPGAAHDPEGKAVACAGRAGPTANQRVWRVVRGRPVSVVTCAVLAWLAVHLRAPGTRALFLLRDKAAWPMSQAVPAWINAHHRQATQEGGCRVSVWRFPRKRPWLQPMAPKWGHGNRAVVAPPRVRSMVELIQRGCAYSQGELTDLLAQPDC
jgi:hypothetical protein